MHEADDVAYFAMAVIYSRKALATSAPNRLLNIVCLALTQLFTIAFAVVGHLPSPKKVEHCILPRNTN